mgnify:CR=1 FL=1
MRYLRNRPESPVGQRGDAMIDLPQPFAVICHDAGAANIILSWLDEMPQADFRAVMEGPAARLWRDHFGDTPTCPTVEQALDGAQALLSGTGWASDLEHRSRIAARAIGIHSVAVIDHWVNYQARFVRDAHYVLPDAVWVTDDFARYVARRDLPGIAIVQKPNLYLAQQVSRIPPLPQGVTGDVLYALEPARSTWGRETAGEFQALDYFLAHRHRVGIAADTAIRLRPHPSDPPQKYARWIGRDKGATIELDRSASLAEAIGPAAIVAGCETFALVVALQAGRRAICTLPEWAPTCSLPHPGLVHLKDFV